MLSSVLVLVNRKYEPFVVRIQRAFRRYLAQKEALLSVLKVYLPERLPCLGKASLLIWHRRLSLFQFPSRDVQDSIPMVLHQIEEWLVLKNSPELALGPVSPTVPAAHHQSASDSPLAHTDLVVVGYQDLPPRYPLDEIQVFSQPLVSKDSPVGHLKTLVAPFDPDWEYIDG